MITGELEGYDGYIASVNASHQKRQDGLRPNSQPLMYIAPIPQSTSEGSQNKLSPSKSVKKVTIKKKNADLKKSSDSDTKSKSGQNLEKKLANDDTPPITENIPVHILQGDDQKDQVETKPREPSQAQSTYVQNILRSYFKIKLADEIVNKKDWGSFCVFLSQTKPLTSQTDFVSRGFNYGVFQFNDSQDKYVWLHYTVDESQGYFAVVNKNLEVVYLTTNVGAFDSCRVINLFKAGCNVLVLTHGINNIHKRPGTEEKEKSTSFYILDKNGLVQLNVMYAPTGEITLYNDYDQYVPEGLTPGGVQTWMRSRVKCRSTLEFSQQDPKHGVLKTTQVLEVYNQGDSLDPGDEKIIEEALEKKFAMAMSKEKSKTETWQWSDLEKMFVKVGQKNDEKLICPPTQLFLGHLENEKVEPTDS